MLHIITQDPPVSHLVGIRNQLHSCVIDDHFLEFDSRVEQCHFFAASQEQSIAELHDVGLVHSCHLLAVVFDGVIESELGDPQRLLFGDDLETLDDSRNSLVFKSRVLAFCLFADDNSVDVLVTSIDTRQADDVDHVSVQVQLITELHVERLQLASATEVRSGKNALQANLVFLD